MTTETRIAVATAVTLAALVLAADLAVVVILPRLGVLTLVSLWAIVGTVVIGAYRVGRARPGGGVS